jgi:hypothetical protein
MWRIRMAVEAQQLGGDAEEISLYNILFDKDKA